MFYSDLQLSVFQYSVLQYSILQYSVLQYSVLQYSVLQYTVLQYTVLQCSVLQYSLEGSDTRWLFRGLGPEMASDSQIQPALSTLFHSFPFFL